MSLQPPIDEARPQPRALLAPEITSIAAYSDQALTRPEDLGMPSSAPS